MSVIENFGKHIRMYFYRITNWKTLSITNSAFYLLIILLNIWGPWQLSLQKTFEIFEKLFVFYPMKLE